LKEFITVIIGQPRRSCKQTLRVNFTKIDWREGLIYENQELPGKLCGQLSKGELMKDLSSNDVLDGFTKCLSLARQHGIFWIIWNFVIRHIPASVSLQILTYKRTRMIYIPT
jgi:hypothetical protein